MIKFIESTAITAAEVSRLAVGEAVQIVGKDAHGDLQTLDCTVAAKAGRKFLTYRVDGELKRCKIIDRPEKEYRRVY
jgi:hypothetical protein